jgi:hypothetical protein
MSWATAFGNLHTATMGTFAESVSYKPIAGGPAYEIDAVINYEGASAGDDMTVVHSDAIAYVSAEDVTEPRRGDLITDAAGAVWHVDGETTDRDGKYITLALSVA